MHNKGLTVGTDMKDRRHINGFFNSESQEDNPGDDVLY